MRHQALDGMRVVIARVAAGVIRNRANHSSLLGAGDVEVPGSPGDDHDVVQIAYAARLHGALPAGVGAHDLVGADGVLSADHRLGVGDLLKPVDAARVEIDDDFPGAVGVDVVENGEGAARGRDLAEDDLLGRLVQDDRAEACAFRDARAYDLRRVADLGGAERRQRMQGCGRRGTAGRQAGDENDDGGAH